jgi:hypothetical protein
MVNGKYSESISCHTIPYGQDGLGHCGGFGIGGSGRDVDNLESKNGDWNRGLFLEQCHSKDCFFSCSGNQPSYTAYGEPNDVRSIDYGHDIGDAQLGYFNTAKESVFENNYVESAKFASSATHSPTIVFSDS